ncbi:dihydroorotate dehydrogenase electron transfer subunit [Thermodesulfobacteriota bacterium]
MLEENPKILFNQKLTPDTWLMGLEASGIVATAKPGQFVMVQVHPGNDPLLRRPFSICGTRADALLILYRVVGKGTSIMAGKKVGERVSLVGPLGRGFEKPQVKGMALMVAGGIGIAPLFFLAQTLEPTDYRFFAGFGTARDIIRAKDILGDAGDVSIATDDGSEGYTGLVTGLLEGYLESKGYDSISLFACGPGPMLRKVALEAMARQIHCQVSLEAAMACGLGACQGCAVKAGTREKRPYYHVCSDGPVFPVSSIDWDCM